jgi:ATP-independent RNA helicase DbpA
MRGQIESLKHGAHIIVGTPGRVRDHQSRESIDLSHIKYVVLDEADRMLDMGFLDEINKILSNVNKIHQTLLFSATFDSSIKSLCKEVTKDAIEVKVDTTHDETNIQEEFFHTTKEDKFDLLLKVLKSYKPKSCIIFCNTKQQVKDLSEDLISKNFSALDLQGDLEQKDRDETLLQFANKSCSILVATDVASRGLDIPDVELVINYEDARNDETYTHRIGRTARAGKSGIAITLCSKKTPTSKDISSLKYEKSFTLQAPMKTICILGGKKKKLRAGDILGALTNDQKLKGEDIGKINITDNLSYVAVSTSIVQKAANILKDGKIKGKKFKSWVLY